VNLPTRSRERSAAPPDLAAACNQVSRAFGVRLGPADARRRLDAAELADLARIARAVSEGATYKEGDGDRRPLAQLPDGDRRRFERLVEKAAGDPGRFDRERDRLRLREDMDKLAVRARRPARRARLEEAGSVTFPAEWLGFLRGPSPVLLPRHAALLLLIEGTWESGESFSPRVRVEGAAEGMSLRVDRNMGLLAGDGAEGFEDWPALLDHLAANGFLEIERRGRDWTVRRGPRSREARARR